MSVFGERLKILRVAKGYTQRDIAKYIDVNPGIVSQWENGKCVLRDKAKAKRLADYLGANFDYLFYGVETKDQEPEKPVRIYTAPKESIPQVTMSWADELPEKEIPEASKPSPMPSPIKRDDTIVYKAEDGRKLDDINLIIRHLRDMHITKDEKIRLHDRLSKWRTDIEAVVLFGE